MTKLKLLLSGACALALTSCVTPAEPPLTADMLLSEPFAMAAGAPFDVEAFFTAGPEWLDVSFADAAFDAASGAMVVRDLAFSLHAAPGARLRAGRAMIWGGDVAAAAALRAGEQGAGAAPLFERAVFENLYAEGLASPDGAQSAAFTADKFVIDGLAMRNTPLAPKAGAPEPLRRLAALALSVDMDAAAYSGLNLRLNENGGGELAFSVAQGFARGVSGGRTEYERVDGFRLATRAPDADFLKEVAATLEGEVAPARPENKILQPHVLREMAREARANPVRFVAQTIAANGMNSVQEIDSIEVRGVDVAGALAWLAKWEMPPLTETDLIDLGSITTLGQREIWNGAPIYSIARSEISAFDFHWLVPSQIETRETGFVWHAANMLNGIAAMEGVAETPESGSRELMEARAALRALGLETVRGDSGSRWRWDGPTGRLATGLDLDLVDLAATRFDVAVDGPSLAEWHALVREGEGDVDLDPGQVSIEGMDFFIADRSLLDRVFAYAAMRAGAEPQAFRDNFVGMMRGMAVGAAEVDPRLPVYMNAIADFLAQGGALNARLAPAAPVSLQTIGEVGESNPGAVLDLLNPSVEHMPE